MDQIELLDRISKLLIGTAAEVLGLRQRLLGQELDPEPARRRRTRRTLDRAVLDAARDEQKPKRVSPLKGIPRSEWKHLKAAKAKPAPVKKLPRGVSRREDEFAASRQRATAKAGRKPKDIDLDFEVDPD